jgi:hypothetical protein
MMMCPECHKASLRFGSDDFVETHGLECGPYERFHDEWYECPACGACFESSELPVWTSTRSASSTH